MYSISIYFKCIGEWVKSIGECEKMLDYVFFYFVEARLIAPLQNKKNVQNPVETYALKNASS